MGEHNRTIQALKVKQWLDEWDKVEFDPRQRKRRPKPHFYVFMMPAAELLALAGISRRTVEGGLPRSEDIGIQRRHDKRRSEMISEFVKYGFPWSELSEAKRASGKYDDLRKPGWLPTAIVVNILAPTDVRRSDSVDPADLVTVEDSDGPTAIIRLPSTFTGPGWRPRRHLPIEVIDGQHRLWAFEDEAMAPDFQLPVVAFHGLDISWQAYLFWSINITPKRINASLAFDMYPLLRTEDWLDRFEGHSIYRETRAQELTEALWSNPSSPWFHRINMLGETGLRETMVSQAAWVRSLMATYLRPRAPGRSLTGGLFAADLQSEGSALQWTRAQQAAFLILAGQKLRDAVRATNELWATSLRPTEEREGENGRADPAFDGRFSLLNQDQGVRAFLHVTNDLSFLRARELKLGEWVAEDGADATDAEAVDDALQSLASQLAAGFLTELGGHLSTYDWRTSSAPGLTANQRTFKSAFRGNGGYRELRRQVLHHLAKGKGDIAQSSRQLISTLGFD